MKLKITKSLNKDIFGQFEGIYLDDKQYSVSIILEGHENQTIFLNKDDKVVIDFLYISKIKEISVGISIEVENFLLTSYAKNPYRPLVVNITGKFNILPQ